MKIVKRNKIKNESYREILDKETHHNHTIMEDEDGTLRWKENPAVRAMICDEKINLNDLWTLLGAMGHNKNSEFLRKLYRDLGYSLFGYWEIFYWEVNNPIAHEYEPNSK